MKIIAIALIICISVPNMGMAVINDETQKEYSASVAYYEKEKARGASTKELSGIAQRIIDKYGPEGIDVSRFEQEKTALQQIRKNSKSEVQTAVKKSYKIDIGDMLSIQVFPAQELSQNVVVQTDGKIVMPMIGEVLAKGATKDELINRLVQKLKVYVANPKVNLTIQSSIKQKIFLMGEVKRPGPYDYREDIRLLEMVSQSGGFTESANLKKIKVYRGEGANRKVYELNLEEIFRSGDFTKDFMLQAGDVAEVSKAEKNVYVIGEVKTPGDYEYKEGMRLLEVITVSGGFTNDALTTRVKVFRGKTPNTKVFEVNMKKVMDKNDFNLDMLLEAGDTVYVQKQGFAKTTGFVDRLSPWLTLINFGLIIAVLNNKD